MKLHDQLATQNLPLRSEITTLRNLIDAIIYYPYEKKKPISLIKWVIPAAGAVGKNHIAT